MSRNENYSLWFHNYGFIQIYMHKQFAACYALLVFLYSFLSVVTRYCLLVALCLLILTNYFWFLIVWIYQILCLIFCSVEQKVATEIQYLIVSMVVLMCAFGKIKTSVFKFSRFPKKIAKLSKKGLHLAPMGQKCNFVKKKRVFELLDHGFLCSFLTSHAWLFKRPLLYFASKYPYRDLWKLWKLEQSYPFRLNV